jgi:protein TonB
VLLPDSPRFCGLKRRTAVRRPNHLSVLPQQMWTNRSIAAVIGVGLIHLLFVYGLLSGLSMRIVQSLPNIVDVRILDMAEPQPVDLPPPPMPDLVQPQVDFVPPPEIRIATPPAATQAITVEQKVAETPRNVASATAPGNSVAASLPAPTPVRSIDATHTTPPYPPLSRRLGEEGIVQLKLAVGTNGRVESVVIERSSGSQRLDDAAREWVAHHWRYHPATRDGKPVASQTQVKVVFNLKTSR